MPLKLAANTYNTFEIGHFPNQEAFLFQLGYRRDFRLVKKRVNFFMIEGVRRGVFSGVDGLEHRRN